jgi:5-methylcytosine-specific restriction endonuclease McrA
LSYVVVAGAPASQLGTCPVSEPCSPRRLGWICPMCLTHWSPDVPICECSNGDGSRRSIPLSVQVAVLERDGWRCHYCSVPLTAPHIDHKTPVIRGGTNVAQKRVAACALCNLRKGTKSYVAFLGIAA